MVTERKKSPTETALRRRGRLPSNRANDPQRSEERERNANGHRIENGDLPSQKLQIPENLIGSLDGREIGPPSDSNANPQDQVKTD